MKQNQKQNSDNAVASHSTKQGDRKILCKQEQTKQKEQKKIDKQTIN